MPPTVRSLSVIVGPPGTAQGTGPPLVRNVPGPVPFTISTHWVAPEGGSWRLGLAIKDEQGQSVPLISTNRWANQHSVTHDFGQSQSTFREEVTLLVLIEKGGSLRFERVVNGVVVGETELTIEVEMGGSSPSP